MSRRQRDWTAREFIAVLLIAAMTSSACSSGCRSGTSQSQAAAAGGTGSSPAVTSTAAAAVAGAAIPALDAAATNDALAYIEQVAGQPANAPPDVAAQAAALGGDPGKVFAFVRREIRYQAYDGVLRGATGALSGRAANAWDTALLVAGLLRKGGFEVRFARGTLPDAAASALVNRMFDQAMQPARQTLSTAGLQPPAAAAAVSDAMRTRIETNWTTNTAEVMVALKQAGITLGTVLPVTEATLLAEARDHVWVEYQDGLQWVPVDPVAATRPGEAAAEARETFTEVPAARQHTVTFALNIEQRSGGAIETKPALTLRAAAADLHARPVMLAHQVDIVGSGAWKATPVLLVGDKAAGGTPYGPSGVQTADNAAAGGIGGRLDQMFGGAPAASAELTAVWLDVTMTSPDGRSETVRREVLDRIGPAARAARSEATAPLRAIPLAGGRPTPLTAVMACAVTAGPLNPAALTARVASAAPFLRDEALMARLGKGDTKGIADNRLEQIGFAVTGALAVLPAAAHVLSQQYAAEAAPALGQAIVFYEARPRLAIATIARADGNPDTVGAWVSLDLRSNAMRAIGRGVAPAAVIAANITRGVLDGSIEDALVAHESPVASTIGVFAEARARGITIAAALGGSVTATGWLDDARARVRATEPSTSVIIAPTAVVEIAGARRAAWWRIDSATGEAIGVLDTGLHGAAGPDYVATLGLLMGVIWGVQLLLSGFVAVVVAHTAVAFLLAAGPGAAAAGQKGWDAAKKSW